MAKEPSAEPSLEARVSALEVVVQGLIDQVAEKQQWEDQRDWPRRRCDQPGCDEVMRARTAVELAKFCAAHNAPEAAPTS